MQRNKIALAKKTLMFLEKQTWNKVILSDIIADDKKISIKSKNELLININRYFDFLLKENLSTLEKSSKKDMLFEIFMARLDILNAHRTSIENLIKYFLSKPQQFIKIAPSFVESIILMATLSNIKIDGIKGIPKIKILFLLYLLIIYSWNKDKTESLEKTMTTLDNYLSNIDKLANLI